VSEAIRAIRYPFALDRGRSELAVEHDHAAHVEQMIRQVLFTTPGERVNRPDFGCGIRRMVFAPLSDVSANLVQITVLDALNLWLSSLIKVEKVEVKFAAEQLDITIAYGLKTTGERRYLNVTVPG
jgi:phage baseplate assembly protein W